MASIISAGTTSGTALNMAGDTSGVLQLATNGSTTALTIDASQRLGIGTASPSRKLDVVVTGTGNVANFQSNSGPNISFTGTETSGRTYLIGEGLVTAGNFSVYDNNASAERFVIDSSGNVGIGTTNPLFQLTLSRTLADQSSFWNDTTPTFTSNFGNVWSNYQVATATHVAAVKLNSASPTTGYVTFHTSGSTERMRIDSSGALILVGSTAQKATGTTWSNPSDQRLKDNIRDYTKGTTELMQVRVREWEYNGKGGTTEGLKGLGVVADEVMTVLPNTVETYDAKLNADDEETTEIKKFDATEITWLLVKTVQEQQTIINDLKARITALEGAA